MKTAVSPNVRIHTEEFDAAFKTFFDILKDRLETSHKERFPTLFYEIGYEVGRRYVKLITWNKSQHQVYGFVDRQTGEVLKAASWKAPAKHARGNIFSEDNGLGCCGQYGVAYLR